MSGGSRNDCNPSSLVVGQCSLRNSKLPVVGLLGKGLPATDTGSLYWIVLLGAEKMHVECNSITNQCCKMYLGRHLASGSTLACIMSPVRVLNHHNSTG